MNIKNTQVAFLEESLIRSGYPMRVGEPFDFYEGVVPIEDMVDCDDERRIIKLSNTPSGSGHDNALKGIIVQFDLQYPEYFSPQLQRYSWIDIVSSQSKMHKLTSRQLTKDDFTEHTWVGAINHCNALISLYKTTESKDQKELTFKELISALPSGYMKWMGISTNYLQLKTIYKQRKNHKLDEWKYFCNWIEGLPSSELITGIKKQ